MGIPESWPGPMNAVAGLAASSVAMGPVTGFRWDCSNAVPPRFGIEHWRLLDMEAPTLHDVRNTDGAYRLLSQALPQG